MCEALNRPPKGLMPQPLRRAVRRHTAIRIGYAHRSIDKQNLTAQHQLLLELGTDAERIYLDRALA